LRQLAANYFRADETELGKAEHLAEWVRLTEQRAKALQVATPRGGRQPAEKGVRKAGRELGLDAGTVSRSVKIDGISAEAKAAARAAKLDDNQSALLAIAKAKPEAQLEKVRELAERKREPGRKRLAVADRATADTGAVEHVHGEVAGPGLSPGESPLPLIGSPSAPPEGAIGAEPETQQLKPEVTDLNDRVRGPEEKPAGPAAQLTTASDTQSSLDDPASLIPHQLSPAEQEQLDDLLATTNREVTPKLACAPATVRESFLDEFVRLVRAL
jgi:hypothetical protein